MDFENRYDNLLNYNITTIQQVIELFHKLVYHPKFDLTNISITTEFVNGFSFAVVAHSNSVSKLCLEIIGNLWSYLSDTSTELTNPEITKKIVRFCAPGSANQHGTLPAAFFAVANYCAISKIARDQLVSLNIISYLVYYFTRETCHPQIYSGLRLSFNLLLYGVDDIWNEIIPLISKIRFHVSNENPKNRSFAARCLILILQNNQHMRECLEQVVHIDLFKSIIMLDYNSDVFDLACLFVKAGIYDNYISDIFIKYCNDFLDRCNDENDISSFFDLLIHLVPKINKLLIDNDTITKIIQIANNGSFGNIKSSAFCLIALIKSTDQKIARDIAINGAFEAFCNLIGVNMDPSDLLIILETIYNFLVLDHKTFYSLSKNFELEDAIYACEIENEVCSQQAQLILNTLSQ